LKYGVIVCPKCGRARGVESIRKTVTCQCGRVIKVGRMKLQYPTDSPLELADIVGKVNASLKGGEPMPKAKRKRKADAYTKIFEKARGIKDPLERMRAVVSELTAMKSVFDNDDIARLAAIIGEESSEALLSKLMANGVVYEVAPGKFKAA
jgi:secreted Zn-dependent insulinase-like peptidase